MITGKISEGDFPHPSTIVFGRRYVLVVTSFSHQSNHGTFKFFNSINEAHEFNHQWSLDQSPEWHADNCEYCASKNLEDLKNEK